LINAELLKGSAFNAEVLLGVVNHGLMISFITLTCMDGQQLNKQYDHNDEDSTKSPNATHTKKNIEYTVCY
jgi:hypothetical protein